VKACDSVQLLLYNGRQKTIRSTRYPAMTTAAEQSDVLPGCTLISRVDVYRTASIDGQRGGTPHIHLACDEMYYGIHGTGAVELLNYDGFHIRPVSPGDAVCFTPGTIHRAINPAGDLVILVIMQNKGLPERGDVAICMPHETLIFAEAYEREMKVGDDATARRRRDLGVQGFLELKQAFERSLEEGRQALDEFYRVAIERTRHQYAAWCQVVEQGPAAEVRRSEQILAHLEAGSIESLRQGRAFTAETGPHTSFGYCGNIHAYNPAAKSRFTPEGIRDRL